MKSLFRRLAFVLIPSSVIGAAVIGAAVIGAAVIGASEARATTILRMDLPALVGHADRIVIGTVKSMTSHWTADRRYIVTDTVLQVDETVHGDVGKEIVVRRLGGSVGGIGMYVAGVVELKPGERVVLFTERRGEHRFVVGMQQGAWRIARDTEGNEIVQRDLHQLQLMERVEQKNRSPSGTGLLVPYVSSDEPSLPLKAFIRQIKSTIDDCKKAASRCR